MGVHPHWAAINTVRTESGDGMTAIHPRKIAGTDPRNRQITFDRHIQRNRPGTSAAQGVIYVGFATFSCDGCHYHGWVFGFNVDSLHPGGCLLHHNRAST